MTNYDNLILGMEYSVAMRHLRIAIIVAWLASFPKVTFETDEERDAVIANWIEAPHDLIMLWMDSDWEALK